MSLSPSLYEPININVDPITQLQPNLSCADGWLEYIVLIKLPSKSNISTFPASAPLSSSLYEPINIKVEPIAQLIPKPSLAPGWFE